MEKKSLVKLHPDLVINKESAIDRLGFTASRSMDQGTQTATKQVQLVRAQARKLCDAYKNCRAEDWCWHCMSGQNGQPLFRGEDCMGCKLLTADAYIVHKPQLVQIAPVAQDEETLTGLA